MGPAKRVKLSDKKANFKAALPSKSSSSENSASDVSSDDEQDSFAELGEDDDHLGFEVDESEEEEEEEEEDVEDDIQEDESDEDEVAKSDKFDTAISAILGSRVKAHDVENPILIRNKRLAKEIEDAKQDVKARKALKAEKLSKKDKARVRDVIPRDTEAAGDVISNEKRLRKIAQRGVVRLLNAINSAQSAAVAELNGGSDKKVEQATTELSKEKFLDMIRMG